MRGLTEAMVGESVSAEALEQGTSMGSHGCHRAQSRCLCKQHTAVSDWPVVNIPGMHNERC